MRCISIGSHGFLAYNDILAGFFTDHTSGASGAIHRVENRKLTAEEIKNFLKKIDESEDVDIETTEEDYGILNNIARYYPEMRYFIHGLKITAAKPSRKKRKDMAEELREKEKKRLKENAAKEEADRLTLKKEKMTKEAEEAPKKKATEDIRKEKVKEAEKKLSETGKSKQFTGFKGLLFRLFDKYPNAKTRDEQEKIKRELKEEWKRYKINEKLYEQNKDLVNALAVELDKGTLNPNTISLMNEMIARDKNWIKEIDLNIEDPTMVIPLEKFAEYIKSEKGEVSSDELRNQLNQLFKEEKLDKLKYKLDLKNRTVNVTTDWNNTMKFLNTFGIKVKDLKKPIA